MRLRDVSNLMRSRSNTSWFEVISNTPDMKLSGEPFSSSLLVRYATATWNSLGLTTGVYSKSDPTLFFTCADRCWAMP